MKIIFWLAFLVLVCGPIAAQTGYDHYRKGDVIAEDLFEPGNQKWELENFKIADGWLTNTKFKSLALLPVEIDQKKDFELEGFFQKTRIDAGSGVIFGDFFVWFSSGYDNGIRKPLVPKCGLYYDPRPGFRQNVDPKYNVSAWNEYKTADTYLITFRKIGSTLYFFLNKELVAQTPFRPFVDSKIGAWGVVNCDFMSVHYLEKAELQRITSTETTLPTNTLSRTMTGSRTNGKYFGLIIGVSQYEDQRLTLDKPSRDAKALKEILINHYSFSDSTTILLLNPTRQKLIAELFRLRKVVGTNDNLLIFYAGHGYWDEAAHQGYWWPSDAHGDDPSFWLSNSDVREQIRSIKSGSTLLVSDACFSGGIFKTRSADAIKNASLDLQLLYKMPSRRAITSGTMTTVPDQSVFFEYFSKRLLENQSQFLSSQQLFDSFRLAVINNSMVVPQDGVIAETGDEGGDFIFIRKK